MEFNYQQLLAASPEHSVWVSASAGTGKTKILTDRVVRLLLQGVSPEKILCLTFTKAAASEMDSRINKLLASWGNKTKEEIHITLSNLLGREPTSSEIDIAPKLLRRKLNAPFPLKIQTIHSFCQFILKKFPLEAGITPGFKVIDEFKADEIIQIIRTHIITTSAQQPDSPLAQSLDFIASHLSDSTIFEIIRDIVSNRQKFAYLHENIGSSEDYEGVLRHKFGLTKYNYAEDILQEFNKFLDNFPPINLTNASKTDLARGQGFNEMLKSDYVQRSLKFEEFKHIFLTTQDEPRKSVFTKKIYENNAGLEDIVLEIQTQAIITLEKLKSLYLIFFTKYLFTLSGYILKDYENAKKIYGYLDYDDLITKVHKLLTAQEAREWVLYKLDGGIEHILVDEAQDTSKAQWDIIESVVAEFYSGMTASNEHRTLFVVGDEKQSIYSFQGADPDSFHKMKEFFASKMQDAEKSYQQINLEYSYRSTEAVIDSVMHVFDHLKDRSVEMTYGANYLTTAFRQQIAGQIMIWPVAYADKQEVPAWPVVREKVENCDGATNLAKKLANYIAGQIYNKTILKAKGRPVQAGDFLVLVRRRNEFSKTLISELKKLKIDVAGIDRMLLTDDLAVKDLMSVAKFVLLPTDDLNFACLLKSPFCGLSERELFEVAVNRDKSLYENLMSFAATIPVYDMALTQLRYFQDLYKIHGLASFFTYLLEECGNYQKLVEASGIESADSINEFLQLAANFEQSENAGLQQFIIWLERAQPEIKRDLETSNALRIMTVHGSKGLQAPIVILADTTKTPRMSKKFLWDEEGLLYWPGYAKNHNHYYNKLLHCEKEKEYLEYLRLLYVALTRAEDELIICGYSNENVDNNCWYEIITAALEKHATKLEDGSMIFSKHQDHSIIQADTQVTISAQKELPPISLEPAQDSILQEERSPANSPFENRDSAKYGTVIHRIMEDYITSREKRLLTEHPLLQNMPEAIRNSTQEKLQNIIQLPLFQNLLSEYELHPEISLGFKPKTGDIIIMRLDLLALSEMEAIIIDYKTDHKVPERLDEVPESYIKQMHLYMKALKQLYPAKLVSCKLVWFETGMAMDIPLSYEIA